MKNPLFILIVIGFLFHDTVIVKAQTEKQIRNDSIQYELKLSKSIFMESEPIIITLIAKNNLDKEIKIWIDAGHYPVGMELKLVDSNNQSMIKQYWSYLSSQTYSLDEVEKMKTRILPNKEFKKKYKLLSIVILKNELNKGVYELRYANSRPVKFEIR